MRLERRLDVLTQGGGDRPARHRSLRATLEWSWEVLDERRAAAALPADGVRGRRVDGAVTAVCSEDGSSIDPLVANLLHKSSLMRTDPRHAEPRLAMLDTVREFAAERAGDLTEAGLRHAHYFVDYCERLATEAARAHRRDSLERLALERANIRLAYERLRARRRGRRGAARGDRLRSRAAVGRAHAGGARLARARDRHASPARTALYWDGRLAISQARSPRPSRACGPRSRPRARRATATSRAAC